MVDKDGNPIKVSDPNQADMCEIIRSIIHLRTIGSKLIDLSKENGKGSKDFFTKEMINCPGPVG